MTRHHPILVLDGDPGPELARRGIPLHPAPGALPLPVREPAAVRTRHVEACLAGADVVTAMTGELHRRALARIGAARRAHEWIAAAMDLARSAVAEADDAGRPARDGEAAPPLRLAGQLCPLEQLGGPDSGPDFAVASAEHRAHAGALADAGAGLLRIEHVRAVGESEAATLAALETGLETWTSVVLDESGRALASGEPLATWLSVIGPLRPGAMLLEAPTWDATFAGLDTARTALDALDPGGATALGAAAPPGERPPVAPLRSGSPPGPAGTQVPLSATLPASDRASQPEAGLLAAGATILAAGADGSPERVAWLRAAVDAEHAARSHDRASWRDRVAAWLAPATARATPGPALWVSTGSQLSAAQRPSGAPGADPAWRVAAEGGDLPLPDRFDWHVIDASGLPGMPRQRYRLVIVAGRDDDPGLSDRLPGRVILAVDALETGAWLLVEGADAQAALAADPRLGDIAPAGPSGSGASSWLARRRP